jgi:ribosomal 50S subunit-associated protein YjgA (DUF615 family)
MNKKQDEIIRAFRKADREVNALLNGCLATVAKWQRITSKAKKGSLEYVSDQRGKIDLPPFSTAAAKITNIQEKAEDLFVELVQLVESQS